MTLDEAKLLRIGDVVVTTETVDITTVDVLPAGLQGIVVDVGVDRALVKIGGHFACLDEWDNCLQVCLDAEPWFGARPEGIRLIEQPA